MRKLGPRWKRDRGAAAVEFALVFSLIFLPFVLGAIDIGYYFYLSEITTNAAREGARAGTLVIPGPWVDPRPDAATAATNYLKIAGMDPATRGITVTPHLQTLVNPWDSVEVDVTYPVGSLTGWWTSIMPATSTARAVMRWR